MWSASNDFILIHDAEVRNLYQCTPSIDCVILTCDTDTQISEEDRLPRQVLESHCGAESQSSVEVKYLPSNTSYYVAY